MKAFFIFVVRTYITCTVNRFSNQKNQKKVIIAAVDHMGADLIADTSNPDIDC